MASKAGVMTVTLPLPFLVAIAVGAALIVAGVTALVVDAWDDAALDRRSWLDHTVKPTVAAAVDLGRRWVHHLVAHPLIVLCPPLGRRLHDATGNEL